MPKSGRTPRIGHPLGPGGRCVEFVVIDLMKKCNVMKMRTATPSSPRKNASKVMLCK